MADNDAQHDDAQHDDAQHDVAAERKPKRKQGRQLSKAQRDARTPAQFAAAIGDTDGGKRVRRMLRSMGVHVSKGHAFTTKHKQELLAKRSK